MDITITDEEIAKFTAINVGAIMALAGFSITADALIQLKEASKKDFHKNRLKINELFGQAVLSGYIDN
jgi:hypothetical protein